MKDLQKYLEIAVEAARAGAEIVSHNFEKSRESQVKKDAKGLVTKTDLEAEKAILKILTSKTNFSVLSEESGLSGEKNGPVWIVDPLDGTNNFAHALPFFAVSVGLMQENESLAGVIIDPINKKEYYACKGNGTFCNGKKLELVSYSSEYIPSVFLNHGYDQSDREKFKVLSKRFADNTNILKLGTTALELCYLANGSVDGFICSGDSIWDFAAGIVIATEAGCIFSDWQGEEWDGKGNYLLYAKPEIHKSLVVQIHDLQ